MTTDIYKKPPTKPRTEHAGRKASKPAQAQSRKSVGGAQTHHHYGISVIVPCYNEQYNLPELVMRLDKSIQKINVPFEIILVDDCSTDETASVIRDLSKKYPSVLGVFHEENKGIVGAWAGGIAQANMQYACFIDADLQNLPEDVVRLYQELQYSSCDLVQGARSSIERESGTRTFISKQLNRILNLSFSMKMQDSKSGFVMARKDVLVDILNHQYGYFYYQTFIAVAAKFKGYSIHEVETLFMKRASGESFLTDLPFMVMAKCLIDIGVAFFEFRLRREKRDSLDLFVEKNADLLDSEKFIEYKGLRGLRYRLFFMTMPLHKWLVGRPVKYLRESLDKTQWLPPEEIRQLQEFRLRKMVSHAYYYSPYYRNLFDTHGIAPSDIQKIEDLQKIPMLSKEDVRRNLYFNLFSKNHDKKKLLRISTSGSTGEPFVLYADKRQLEYRMATTFRAMEWTGWRFGDRQARLWHQTIGMRWSQVVREYIDAFFLRRLFIPAYEIREQNISGFLNKIRRHKPVLLDGYAESFNFLAEFISEQNSQGIRPKAVISSAQILPEQVREKIETHLQTKVYDKYGSREFSGIAYECEEQDGHHVMAESYIVEIVKNDRPAKPGELGEVLITDLNNFSVPLIRYRVGDLAVAVDNSQICACGRGLPRIGRIEGRTQAIIYCANGAWLPGTFFAHYFKEHDHIIRQYQVVQNEPGVFVLKIIKGGVFNEGQFKQVIDGLIPFIGEKTRVDVVFTDDIPLGKTGKRTSVVSNVKLDFQEID